MSAFHSNLAELYAAYRLDGTAVTEAIAELLLPAAGAVERIGMSELKARQKRQSIG